MLTRSSHRAIKARRARTDQPRPQVATVTLPVDILHMVHLMQLARNQGRDEIVVELKTWRVQIDDQS